jgi:transposase
MSATTLALKKSLRASEQDRPDVAKARQLWKQQQYLLDSARLVFIDETGTNTAMIRLRGRCRKGTRLVAHAPHGHWKTTTFVAALRCDTVTAPLVVDGPMNGERAYVEQHLAPTLRPGDIVIMDNLAAHKVGGIREMIQAARALLIYLPPYSPDLNPIEQCFAKLKALLRKAAARTISALWETIGTLLASFSAQECSNYLRHAGYVSK